MLLSISVGLLENTSDKFTSISSTLTVAAIDIILIMRVWILFGRLRRLLYILASMMLGAPFTIAAFITRSVHEAILPGCYATRVNKYLTFYAAPSLVITFIMFAMTVYNCTTRLGLTFSSRNTMPLVSLFFRDGIYWFLAVVAVNPPQLILWAVGVYSIIGSRVLLNIKEIMTYGVVNREIITV
ncbi:hypothetical protein FB451DRAFT_1226357 [Mycena latifolia]|nr:hypothetical protein FB451DRAFT_1226357 [Mycena latifolia]